MNIGFVVHDYDRGEGHGRYACEIVERISDVHDVTLYARNITTQPPASVEVIEVKALSRPSYGTVVTFPGAFDRIRKKHDVVHAQGWSTRNADVVTAHICLASWRRAVAAQHMTSGWGEKLFGGYVERSEGALYREATRAIIAPSMAVATDLRHHYKTTRDITVVPHGFSPPQVDRTSSEARSQLGIEHFGFTALYVGDARKGLENSIIALGMTEETNLVAVTRTPLGWYQKLAEESGVAARIKWVGGMKDTSVAYAAADVLLHPTVYDAFGLVVSEAMSAHLPVIVSTNAGVSELVEHNQTGWILPSTDSESIAMQLSRVRNRSDRLSEVANAALAVAQANTWDHNAEKVLEVYDRVRRSP